MNITFETKNNALVTKNHDINVVFNHEKDRKGSLDSTYSHIEFDYVFRLFIIYKFVLNKEKLTRIGRKHISLRLGVSSAA